MRRISAAALFVALACTGLIGASAHGDPSAFGSPPKESRSDGPQLAGLQLLFKGQPVDQVVSSKKLKKYSIAMSGVGFLPDSRVVVSSFSAFPVTFDEPPQQPVATSFETVTSLEAVFLPGAAPPPGLLVVRVVNPDGGESNSIAIDVISKPSLLSIESISPEGGPTGTEVTLKGTGFMQAPPRAAAIRVTVVGSQDHSPVSLFQGFYTGSIVDDTTMTFILPSSIVEPICPGSPVICDPIAIPPVTQRQYRIQVINPNGMSNSVLFDVSSK